MTKKELINEIKSIVINNGGELSLDWVYLDFRDGELVRLINGCSKKVKYEKIAQIQIYLDCLNDMEAKKVETVETEAENNTDKNVEEKVCNVFDETAIEVVNHWAAKYFPICKSGMPAVGVMRDEHLIVVYADNECNELFSIWVDCEGFIEYDKGDCSYINNAAMNIAMALEDHVTVEYVYDE